MSNRTEKRCRFRNQQKEQHLLVNARRQTEHQACVANLPPERIVYVTLDIGKNAHWSRADSGSGRMVRSPQEFSTTQEGYLRWRQQLGSYLSGDEYDLVILGHEPTGVYHESWARQILSDFAAELQEDAAPRLIYRMLNPYQVKLERTKLVLRSRKSDQIDLLAMRNLLQQGQGNRAVLPTPENAALNQSVALSRQAAYKLKACRTDLRREFDRIWPGAIVNVERFRRAHPDMPVPTPIVQTKPLERSSFRILLEHAPNPYEVRQLGVQGIIDLFHRHDAACGKKTAARILACANHALPPPKALAAVYLQGLQQLHEDEEHWLARHAFHEAQLAEFVQQTPARFLLSIKGISPAYAAYYLSLVGAPPFFDWADQVWAYVGFDPIQSQSGDSDPNRHFNISRHGDPFYRNILTWMACLAAGHHPTFGLTFIQAEERGLHVWGAAIHTAHKLNRTCFRLLLEERPWRDATHPDDLARWRTYWLAYRQHRSHPDKAPAPPPWRPTAAPIAG